ncbi:MAG: hypothetical protein M3Z03_12160, partial [Actinomycetota bacterium]|nr:hypothetical protein [Actinomycetota bacterium]
APLVLLALVVVAVVAGAIIFAVSGDDDDSEASGPRDRIEQDGTTTTADEPDGDEDEDDAAAEAGTDTKAAVEQTGAPNPGDPQRYGDDAALDKLHDACKGGDMPACDRLYRDSGFGTAYEAFGDTCGDRNRSQGYCTDLYPATGGTTPSRAVSDGLADTTANTYGDDPDLDRFWDDCYAGAMTACDSLYLSAPSGTDYEVYGATCGGRNEVQGYCSELYG